MAPPSQATTLSCGGTNSLASQIRQIVVFDVALKAHSQPAASKQPALIRIMADENLEEWGSSIWVETETVKSTIEAYARGEIKLGAIPRKANKSLVCSAPSVIPDAPRAPGEHPYTHLQIGRFLGWTRKGGKEPDNKCDIALKCLQAIELGCVDVAHLRGLQREEAKALCGKAVSAYKKTKTRSKERNGEVNTSNAHLGQLRRRRSEQYRSGTNSLPWVRLSLQRVQQRYRSM